MSGHNDGRAEIINLLEYLHHFVSSDRVQVTGGLIRDNYIRLINDGASNSHALSLSAGKLMREIKGFVFKIDQPQSLRHVLHYLLVGTAIGFHGESDILKRCLVG